MKSPVETRLQDWSRIIALVDMDAFFAGIEQHDVPELRGRPIGITNGAQSSTFITCSYEARSQGIRTGMRLEEARRLCPAVIQVHARPDRYAEVSTLVMAALESITPDIEVFSVDEAFLDLTFCKALYDDPWVVGEKIQTVVFAACGVRCTVGISGDRTTAKVAAKKHKPNGLGVVLPELAREYLRHLPVTDVCGIGPGIAEFLAQRGVIRCGDMSRLPIGELARRYGNPGRRLWHMTQGTDPEPLRFNPAAPKSLGHGKVLPPYTKDSAVIRTYFSHMAEKVGARLRRHGLAAEEFSISMRTYSGTIRARVHSELPTNDGKLIFRLALSAMMQQWRDQPLKAVQITARDPKAVGHQRSFFDAHDAARTELLEVVDNVNTRYGEFALAPASLMNRSKGPNVIAPSWKPTGHRKTV